MKAKAYINGRIAGIASAALPITDRGLAYGDGAFETMLYDGREVRLLKNHIQRLGSALKELAIPRAGLKGIGKVILRLLKINGLEGKPARIKVMVERGSGASFAALPGPEKAVLIVMATKVDKKAANRLSAYGADAVLYSGPVRAIGHLKTLNYLPSVLAKAFAARHGAYEAVFLTPGGHVLEASASNIFAIKGNTLLTPALTVKEGSARYSVLPGITRAHVMKTASKIGLKVIEGKLKAAALVNSDEAFLTNAVTGIVPLVRLDRRPIGSGTPGPFTCKLITAVEASFIKQAKSRAR